MIAHDIDRQVSSYALKSWMDVVGEGDGKLLLDEAPLLSFIQRAMLDPSGVYLYLNPAPPVVAPVKKIPGRAVREEVDLRTKAEGDEENEQDRKARLRVGSLGSVAWILGKARNLIECTVLTSRWQTLAPNLQKKPRWTISWVSFALPCSGHLYTMQRMRHMFRT